MCDLKPEYFRHFQTSLSPLLILLQPLWTFVSIIYQHYSLLQDFVFALSHLKTPWPVSNWLAPSLHSNQLPLHKSLNTLYWPPYKPSPLQSDDNLPLSKRELLSNWPYVFINAFIISPILPGSSIFFAPRAVPGTQTVINKQVLKEGQEMSAQTTPNLFFCPFFTSKILISLGSNSIFFPSKEYSATLYYKDLILCESWPNAYFIHSIHYTCDTAS